MGASPERRQLADELSEAGWSLVLLEICEANAEFYRSRSAPFSEVVTGDVRHLEVLGERCFDLAVWWHGPEHVSKENGIAAIKELEEIADTVILASPFGWYAQDEVNGNRNEIHRSGWMEEDFQCLGYETDAIGTDGRCGSHVLAWKVVREVGE